MQRSTKLHLSLGKRKMRLTSDATIQAFGGRYSAALSSDLARSTSLQFTFRHGSRSQDKSKPDSRFEHRPYRNESKEESRSDSRDAGRRSRPRLRAGGMPHRSRKRRGPRRNSRYDCIASELSPVSHIMTADRGSNGQEALQHRAESDHQPRSASQGSSMDRGTVQQASGGALNSSNEQLPWWQEVPQAGVSARASFSGQVSDRCSRVWGGTHGLEQPLHGHLRSESLDFKRPAIASTSSPAGRWRPGKASEKSYAHRGNQASQVAFVFHCVMKSYGFNVAAMGRQAASCISTDQNQQKYGRRPESFHVTVRGQKWSRWPKWGQDLSGSALGS